MKREFTDEMIINLIRWMAWSEPMKFRKKPVVIEATQWFPPGDERHNPDVHCVGCEVGMADIGAITVAKDGHNCYYSMKTVNGWARLNPGDWIIVGPKTEKTSRDIYPCKQDVFEQTYEPAE